MRRAALADRFCALYLLREHRSCIDVRRYMSPVAGYLTALVLIRCRQTLGPKRPCNSDSTQDKCSNPQLNYPTVVAKTPSNSSFQVDTPPKPPIERLLQLSHLFLDLLKLLL